MTSGESTDTTRVAALLGEHTIRGFGRGAHGLPYMWDACNSFDTRAEWAEHVAAVLVEAGVGFVAQAKAEERERIASRIEALMGRDADYDDGMEDAALIARGDA